MTILHAGGKFGGGGYKVSGGLHGVGISVVNALSEHLKAEVRRDGSLYVQEYARGKPLAPVERVGPADGRGTTITFSADSQIFTELDFNFDVLAQRFREMAYLNKAVRLKFVDERADREASFYFDGGITAFVRKLNAGRAVVHQPIALDRQAGDTAIEVALQYNDGFTEAVYAFANTINNVDGGTHITGFRTALTRTLNDYGRKANLLKDADGNLTGEDVREGLTAVISVKLPEPQFEGQTKTKLGNAEVRLQVEAAVSEALNKHLEENPQDGRRIIDKCLTAARAREAARKARDLVIRKSALDGLALPGK
jgi:DNA gyrase subunit B